MKLDPAIRDQVLATSDAPSALLMFDALNGKDTSFVLSPEGNFFRFFGGWTGGGASAGAPNSTPRAANPATGGAGAGAPPR